MLCYETYDAPSQIKISQIMLDIGLSSGTHIEDSDDSTACLHMFQVLRPFITGDCLVDIDVYRIEKSGGCQ